MDGSIKELAKYRFEKAYEDLEVAKMNHNNLMYKASINRSYYAIFHAMRAVTILEGYDSSKHSGIIAFLEQIDKAKGFLIVIEEYLVENKII